MVKLYELSPAEGSTRKRKRKGRGVASGNGTTAGRGYNGQNSRSGGKVRAGFEGGQMPLHRRLPKRGFTSIFKTQFAVVNLSDLSRFEANALVDEATLLQAGVVRQVKDGVKLLAKGDVSVPLTVQVSRISQAAKAKIEAAGGKVEG
ncbi:LSU ribosomal protein L15P [Desulfobotulus alkaliphilus]|uniref:Large ribosomal subunit protein uL15 n=1 Tax=Desulfobotulus alkaliphilus TaxID=622671 RepID=A0A562RRD8_9BACT|nr:50S ribosomal protein L15 [Desulfobotulus alkaliphilus]TWI71641.1 LSU ribosomal protein L15P [Desulfobotulus alkaliphilus]